VTVFIGYALALVMGMSAGEQARTANPCVDSGSRRPRLLPVDEASSNSDFLRYRARLRTAIERRDLDAVVEAADPAIRLGFDASGGRDLLRQRLTERAESWEELRVALAHGGSFSSPSSFAAPYVYSEWPETLDSFQCAAITGSNVRLREAPGLDAAIVTSVSYSIVRVLDEREDRLWRWVELGDGRTGFIWHAYVRRPIDYRALFNRIDGRWRMTAFVAGD
jgi:hypothetical protein